jgi:hypothetical protein
MKYQNEKEAFQSLNLMMSKDWIDKDSGENDVKITNVPM